MFKRLYSFFIGKSTFRLGLSSIYDMDKNHLLTESIAIL